MLNATWKWSDDLNIYAGDEIEQYLSSMNVDYDEIKLLRSPGGLEQVLQDEDSHQLALQALAQISQLRGNSLIWNKDHLMDALDKVSPRDLAQPRGKQVSELDVLAGDSYKDGLRELGKSVGIEFDFNVYFRWYPIDSQRTLLYAAQFGAQEAFADAMARRHFTMGQPSGDRTTVLDASQEVGLDPQEVETMLESDDFESEVWQSYKDTTGKHRIHSIPFLSFNGPQTNGGKFGQDGVNQGEKVVRGSGNVEQFLDVFETIRREQLD